MDILHTAAGCQTHAEIIPTRQIVPTLGVHGDHRARETMHTAVVALTSSHATGI